MTDEKSRPNAGGKKSRRSFGRKTWIVLIGLGVAGAAWLGVRWSQSHSIQPTPGPETTIVTEPRREGGLVAYIAALNDRTGGDVKPADNAAIPLLGAVGADVFEEPVREQVLARLGAPLPKVERPFVPLSDFTSPEQDAARMLERISRGPWRVDEFPEAGRWLRAIEPALDAVEEASRRPRYFMPLATDDPSGALLSVRLPHLAAYQHIGRALAARAMLAAGAGLHKDMLNDLRTLRRLARLMEQTLTVRQRLAGYAFAGNAALAERAVGLMPPDQGRTLLAELLAEPPPTDMANVLDIGERWMVLDVACLTAAGQFTDATETRLLTDTPADWNEVLRRINAFYDRNVETFDQPTLAARTTAANAVADNFVRNISTRTQSSGNTAMGFISPLRRNRGTWVVSNYLLALFAPATEGFHLRHAKLRTEQEIARAVLALGIYAAEHERWPDSLADLTPDLLPKVPTDWFADDPLCYRRTDGGAMLWSVGANTRDESGQGDDDVVRFSPLVMPATQPTGE